MSGNFYINLFTHTSKNIVNNKVVGETTLAKQLVIIITATNLTHVASNDHDKNNTKHIYITAVDLFYLPT